MLFFFSELHPQHSSSFSEVAHERSNHVTSSHTCSVEVNAEQKFLTCMFRWQQVWNCCWYNTSPPKVNEIHWNRKGSDIRQRFRKTGRLIGAARNSHYSENGFANLGQGQCHQPMGRRRLIQSLVHRPMTGFQTKTHIWRRMDFFHSRMDCRRAGDAYHCLKKSSLVGFA